MGDRGSSSGCDRWSTDAMGYDATVNEDCLSCCTKIWWDRREDIHVSTCDEIRVLLPKPSLVCLPLSGKLEEGYRCLQTNAGNRSPQCYSKGVLFRGTAWRIQ